MNVKRKAYKSLAALVGSELAAVGTAMLNGGLTWHEVTVATGASLVVAAGVWRVPNPPKHPDRQGFRP